MWAESDLCPGVPCLQSRTEPVNGNVYRMYHGTTERAAEQIKISGFQPSAGGMLGRGVYLSRDLNKASRYPLDNPRERVVIRVKVNVGRVKKIDKQPHPLQKTWHDHGYDTAWCPPNCGMVKSGLEEDCVWDPRRITIIDVIPPSLQSEENPVEGKDYTMFYGTSKEEAEKIKANGFCQSNDILGPGVYLSRDSQKAFKVPTHVPEQQRSVLRVKVNVGKVIQIDYLGYLMQTNWHGQGYDSAWTILNGLEQDCVWDPRRITVIDVIRPMEHLSSWTHPDTCAIYTCFQQEAVSFRSNIRGANMWAEDDLGPGAPPCLNSYIAPVEGNIYRMYHGTSRENAEKIKVSGFKQSSGGMLGRGVYLSRDLQKASRYPLELPESKRVVLRVKVNVGRVKKIDCQGHPLQKTWHEHGYNTAWCPPNCGMVPSGLEEDCVWDPQRITVIGEIRPRTQGAQGACQQYFYPGANMWVEDDLVGGAPPRLQSDKAPADNNVYTMYHGTSMEAAEKIKREGFRPSANGMLGPGVYLSRDLQKAFRVPMPMHLLPGRQQVILRVKVNVGKVIRIDRQGHQHQRTWHDEGYDTAWCPPNCGMVPSGLEEFCVWDPKQITVIDEIRPNQVCA
ncbi:grass carp reovirus (GCRV)-induced gene 2e [Carassius gibelio]|uniref:grass carp reovirus (GCRV)-induced gene 2e n=1 Tax=Carassius gibelio TaxID=101364 RepID=UPI002277BA29|nr:grass carp reovirus (GCRV)-induced gene 2e [Carassius gibelio]